jgi:FixJ family two-component response regulator
MRAGAVDFVEKPFAEKEILAAVDGAREHQVMHLLVGGRQNKSIAHELGISPAASRSIACASWKKPGRATSPTSFGGQLPAAPPEAPPDGLRFALSPRRFRCP